MPPPYDLHRFLDLLGIELDEAATEPRGWFTVTEALIAGTGYLWAPVVVALADALCAIGVPRHMPETAGSFTTVESKTNFFASAEEGHAVSGTSAPVHLGRSTQVWDARIQNDTTGRLIAAYRCTQLLLYPPPSSS